jgi:hypothetical protein
VEGGGGSLPSLPCWGGGEGGGGLVHPVPCHLPLLRWVTGYTMLSPHDQGWQTLESPGSVDGPWTSRVS